ncbi:MAG: response regulator, partial [Sphingobacteriales bacterium]
MILIIDDDLAVRTSLSLLLENEGFEVISAESHSQAIRLLVDHTPELIILDLNFSIDTSGKEGMSLFEAIKAINSFIPVILLTGWGTIELAVKGMKMGAAEFLTKPWSNAYLLQSIQTILKLKERTIEKHSRKKLDDLYHFEQI